MNYEDDDLSFIIPAKEIKIRKSWGNVKPQTKIHKSKKGKRAKSKLKQEIEKAINEIDEDF